MKAAEAMARILKLEGVKFVTCFPPNQLINPSDELGIRTILARQERVAVNIADGYTRVSRQTGVALVAAGVGVENAFSGISQAYADLVPMLVVADQLPRGSLGGRRTQDLDALFALHKVTKWSERVETADRVPEFMRRAFTYLRTGRPGPVFLELPLDIGRETVEESHFAYRPVAGWRAEGNPRDVEVAARAFLAARRPLIYAGEGVYYAGAWTELHRFAELVQAPVMTTLKGKGVFPEDHPLSVGQG
ncbi:MAG: thiamine pyrophosphate-binding protein, partial [Candidatus Bathyarchaeia archaeon]